VPIDEWSFLFVVELVEAREPSGFISIFTSDGK
jgi:hypothetical protein